jgi:glyoxylase-like metal-dependent hydrolase (beta-lactamase superfamily II)
MKQAWKVKIFEWGSFALDGGAMFGIIPKPLWSKNIVPDEVNRIPLALRSLYLERGEQKVLVDLGMGLDWDEKLKKIYNLQSSPAEEILKKQLNITPQEITHVVLTHLHFDHCGFLSSSNSKQEKFSTFENAEIFVTRSNYENALNPNTREKGSYLKNIWELPARKGQLTLVDCQWLEFRQVLPGLYMRRVDGHTKGQAIVYVEGTDKNYLFLADLCPTENHLKDVWIMGYDANPSLSIQEKQRIFSEDETKQRELVLEHSSTKASITLCVPNSF